MVVFVVIGVKKEWTSVGISKSVKSELRRVKIHHRESDDEVILRLIGFYLQAKNHLGTVRTGVDTSVATDVSAARGGLSDDVPKE